MPRPLRRSRGESARCRAWLGGRSALRRLYGGAQLGKTAGRQLVLLLLACLVAGPAGQLGHLWHKTRRPFRCVWRSFRLSRSRTADSHSCTASFPARSATSFLTLPMWPGHQLRRTRVLKWVRASSSHVCRIARRRDWPGVGAGSAMWVSTAVLSTERTWARRLSV